MDILDDFLNPNRIFEPTRVPSAQVDGRTQNKSDSESEDSDSEPDVDNTDYAREYQRLEAELYAKGIKAQEDKELFSVEEGIASAEAAQSRAEGGSTDVFNKYPFDCKSQNDALTIQSYRAEILSMLKTNSVVIIQGPTGCGKTTQVPQYILDDCRENNQYCNIVVTQPRRIAAISVAKRVCEERGWALGTVCGYQVGLEKRRGPDTIISYVTTGVLLRSLIKVKHLHNYTHIIVDEVHERNQDMDFLLLLIRRFLYTNSLKIKVVLMSATFDTTKFQHYFRNNSRDIEIFPPTIFVTKESKFRTQMYYADQLKSLGKIPQFDFHEPKIEDSMYELLVFLIRIFDKFDKGDPKCDTIGSVLVFLPGIYEIEEAYRRLTEKSKTVSYQGPTVQWQILPLHSSITNHEQRNVFNAPAPGHRKIILSTNIAESSITVSDIVYVIDFCLTKTMAVNPETKYESLQLQWASRVNCTQRAGRTGRVADGRVYRFVTRNFYENYLDQDITPEILRAPLEHLVLTSKLLDLNDPPKAILALTIDPPNLKNIESTIWSLKELGGLAITCRGIRTVSDGDLTFLGHVMASLPLSVTLAKLIFLGNIFSCLSDCIIMAAGCSLPNIFSQPFQERLTGYMNRLQWADSSASDLISYLNLYKVWERKKRSNAFSQRQEEINWAKQNYVNLRAMNEWAILIKELTDRLAWMGIKESVGPGRVTLGSTEIPLVIKVVICGAFYPHYFRRSSDGGQVDEREAVKTLGGRDPCKTVYFTHLDRNQPGPIYARRIKELFRFCSSKINVYFDNSFKVYVEFTQVTSPETVCVDGQHFITSMPGKICKEVYCAVRHRQLGIKNVIPCLAPRDSWKYAKELGISEVLSTGTYSMIKRPGHREVSSNSVLPTLDTQYIKIVISDSIDAGHFWAHNVDDQTYSNLQMIQKHLNMPGKTIPLGRDVKVGDLCCAKFDDGLYYRCKVISISMFRTDDSTAQVQVLFIDYGNVQTKSVDELYFIPIEVRNIAPLAMECVLCEIQPSLVLNTRALWTEQANALFDKKTKGINLYAKIYSVVNDVVHLELYNEVPGVEISRNAKPPRRSFNQYLIDLGYAQKAKESFLSEENHMKRVAAQNYDTAVTDLVLLNEEEHNLQTYDVEPPDYAHCKSSFTLNGPHSPLEMKIYSMLENGLQKAVNIEGASVNSVLLDTDPQDPHERLVVAATVAQSAVTKTLSLRHSTIMPNIHGFPMLMALIFCPTMEPKPTKDGMQFGAILCGLGTHENSRKSMYPAHDLVMTLDTELTQEILNEINEVRFWLNRSVRTMESTYNQVSHEVDIETCQRALKEKLFQLLKRPMKSIDRSYVKHANEWHKFLYVGDILEAGEHNFMQNEIWPLHWTMTLNTEDQTLVAYKKNLNEMVDVATRVKPMTEVTCELCSVTLYSIAEVRIHLVSKAHMEKVKTTVPDYKNE